MKNGRELSPWLTNAKFLCLGLPSWALVDGTWAILYQLAQHLPEGYSISSYLMLSLTLGNAFPIILGSTVLPGASLSLLYAVIVTVVCCAFCGGILLSVCWNISLTFQQKNISFPFFFLFFLVGGCANLSNVTHFTFVSRWPQENTTFLATGTGLGSSLAGMIALLLGTLLYDYGFTIGQYYALLTLLLFIPALFSLFLLKREVSSDGDKYEAARLDDVNDASTETTETTERTDSTENAMLENISVPEHTADIEMTNRNDLLEQEEDLFGSALSQSKCSDFSFCLHNRLLLMIQFFTAAMGYGVIPSLLSTVCGKFSDRNLILLLCTSIAAVLDPLFRASTNFPGCRVKTVPGFVCLFVFMAILSTVMIVLALLPPSSTVFNSDSVHFGFIPVLTYVCFSTAHVYTNTAIFRYFKDVTAPENVQQSYRIVGIASQVGSLVGTLTTFFTVISSAG